MAIGNAVWGIDVGQCSLKALRCTLSDDGTGVVAEAFDFIEYPKILSQPEADPDALVHEALAQFLSRNSVKGDKVAVSVSGQSGLARFIKLPPVESKKIPDIVKYEARQQIPFDLDDVIWDYEQLAGGSEEDGVSLETEVGLFAMKRDQVFRAIRPFDEVGIELDYVQLTPLCIYNCVVFDMLANLRDAAAYDPENPPESLVVLSFGTETTDLVVTNGFRVWQRSIPLGGNHFTKQLTKELKLTFAKAEHLKRNARQAEDPKTVFQAMRPVFNDMAREVQRSIGYFQSIDRQARIGRIVALGNATKLPGLTQYLSKKLGNQVDQIEAFESMTGPSVVSAPVFKDNLPSFAVCYGLCLQGLGRAKLSTSLLPREILVDRLIRRKKPWAVAIVASLALGLCLNVALNGRAWRSVRPKHFSEAFRAVERVDGDKRRFDTRDQEQVARAAQLKALGDAAVGNAENRLLWPELLTAINSALPLDDPPGKIVPPTGVDAKPLEERPEMHIVYVESEYFPDLGTWFNNKVRKIYREGKGKSGLAPKDPAVDSAPPGEPPPDAPPPRNGAEEAALPDGQPADGGEEGPSGAGWVIELFAYHDYHIDQSNAGEQYVRDTLLKKLEEGTVKLPAGPGKPEAEYTMKELGIGYPILAHDERPKIVKIENPAFQGEEDKEGGSGLLGDDNGTEAEKQQLSVERYYFYVQFCWKPTSASVRESKRKQQAIEAEETGGDLAGGA